MTVFPPCPKCRGRLSYDTEQDVFFCDACGNRFFREMLLGKPVAGSETTVYRAPATGTEEICLSSQFEEPTDDEPVKEPLPMQSVSVEGHTPAKATGPSRQAQRMIAAYDKERQKREENRRVADEEISRGRASVSEGVLRANLHEINAPRSKGRPVASEETSVSGQIVPSELPTADDAPDTVGQPMSRDRLKLAVRAAEGVLKEKKAVAKKRSREIWKLERQAGESRTDFKRRLDEANREIDLAEIEVKEAKVALKEAKRAYKQAGK